jgi:hypothetical protein
MSHTRTDFEKTPRREFQHSEPIERLLVRNGFLFFVFFRRPHFWVTEFDNPKSHFLLPRPIQRQIYDMHEISSDVGWLRFPSLDAFDISANGCSVVVGNECKLIIFDFLRDHRTEHNLFLPARICRFRGSDILIFTQRGELLQLGDGPLNDHWHFVCPNAVVFDSTTIYSGGFEGVLSVFRTNLNRHAYLPRLGVTIESLSMSPNSALIAAISDRNMLALVDCAIPSLRASVSHPFGDHMFHKTKMISIRRPNLVQFFDVKTGHCITQLQTSSFNATVPVTALDFRDGLLVTVETFAPRWEDDMTMAEQSEQKHKLPHANSTNSLLPRRRVRHQRGSSGKRMCRVNPFLHDCDESVGYCELKFWVRREDGSFEIDERVRVSGRQIHCVAIHPELAVLAIAVGGDVQLWKRSGKWCLWRSILNRDGARELMWSPDGSILLVRFAGRVGFCDVDKFVWDIDFEWVEGASFLNDSEVVVRTRSGLTVLDLKSQSAMKRLFVAADCSDSCQGVTAFVVNRDQPLVVLVRGDCTRSWQLPTESCVHCVHVTNDKLCVRITAVDDENVIWSIEEYGAVEGAAEGKAGAVEGKEGKETKLTAIVGSPRRQPAVVGTKVSARVGVGVEVKVDRTRQILDMLSVPSHQIPRIDDVCEAVFGLLMEDVRREEGHDVVAGVDEVVEIDEVDEVEAVSLNDVDLTRLKGILSRWM